MSAEKESRWYFTPICQLVEWVPHFIRQSIYDLFRAGAAPHYNWRTFTLCNIYFENEHYLGQYELHLVVLGIGFNVTYTYDPSILEAFGKQFDEMKEEFERNQADERD
jgi:hypothetical protein